MQTHDELTLVIRSFVFPLRFGTRRRLHEQGNGQLRNFGILLTPVFYYVLQSFSEWWNGGVYQGHVRRTGTPDGLAPVTAAHQSSAMSEGH